MRNRHLRWICSFYRWTACAHIIATLLGVFTPLWKTLWWHAVTPTFIYHLPLEWHSHVVGVRNIMCLGDGTPAKQKTENITARQFRYHSQTSCLRYFEDFKKYLTCWSHCLCLLMWRCHPFPLWWNLRAEEKCNNSTRIKTERTLKVPCVKTGHLLKVTANNQVAAYQQSNDQVLLTIPVASCP